MVAAARLGDRDAFASLVRSSQDLVLGLCLSILRERSVAEDAAQEAFIKAYKALSSFRGDAKFSTWVYRIARNHCLNIVKKSGSSGLVPIDFASGLRESPKEPTARDAGGARARFGARFAQEALSRLPQEQSECMFLRLQGLDYAQIAEAMGVSADSVKARLRRARETLRAEFGGRSDESSQSREDAL